jgi:hypothetical protein
LKKLLSAILIIILGSLITVGFLVWQRYSQNPEQIVPYPYTFQDSAPALKLDAPILITGDQMGEYFARFGTTLAEAISVNLAKPIKIQSIAKKGQGLHRTLHQLRSLTQWPQILIYQGGSEEFLENKFNPSEIVTIRQNFNLYLDDRVETFLILYPWLSRIVYTPVNPVILNDEPNLNSPEEKEYLKRLETELLLYEQQLTELVKMSKDKNSLLVLTTTPINLEIPPKKVCEFTTTMEIDAEILTLRDLLKAGNPKEAYNKSKFLITQHSGNAELLFIHGQIAKRLGRTAEAIETLLSASAYDCLPWRTTEVHNSIIRKVARAKLVEKDFTQNTTFFDELYPQNLYYDKGMQQLGLVIKTILKL